MKNINVFRRNIYHVMIILFNDTIKQQQKKTREKSFSLSLQALFAIYRSLLIVRQSE